MTVIARREALPALNRCSSMTFGKEIEIPKDAALPTAIKILNQEPPTPKQSKTFKKALRNAQALFEESNPPSIIFTEENKLTNYAAWHEKLALLDQSFETHPRLAKSEVPEQLPSYFQKGDLVLLTKKVKEDEHSAQPLHYGIVLECKHDKTEESAKGQCFDRVMLVATRLLKNENSTVLEAVYIKESKLIPMSLEQM